MELHNLKVNGVREPLGYHFDYLTFSWELRAQEVVEDLVFTVQVAKSPLFEEVIWEGQTSTTYNQLTTNSQFLEPKTRYYWKVKAENYEATSRFETAKMDEKWEADWISYDGEAVDSVTFSKRISIRKPVRSARLYALGLGVYEVEINGKKIGREYLTPGYHSYDLVQHYQTYDVTRALTEETELAFLVGNGWYRGRFVFEGGFENIYGDKQKVIAELWVTYQDGTTDIISTDGSWTTQTNRIQSNSIYDGEVIDYGHEERALPTLVVEGDAAHLQARIDLPVEVVESFQPSVFEDQVGNIVLDYGQELTGWITGVIPAGKERVRFQFGELLQDGCFYTDNLRTAKQEFVILNSQKEQKVRPHFTFYGFRYVKVEGLTAEEAQGFVAQALQSKMDETLVIQSSHDKLNQLVSNIRWSQKDNFLSIPTDCPQRDERMGWTGDITVFANTACYNMESRAFLGNFTNCLRLEQQEMNGSVPFFAPYPKIAPQEGLNPFLTMSGAAVWGDAGTVLPHTLYRHYRDSGLLRSQVDLMVDWVQWIYQQDQARGGKRLWDFGMQLGDWLALDTGIPGMVMGATDSALIASVYYYKSSLYVSQLLEVLADERAEFYRQLASEIRSSILETYFDQDQLILEPSTLQSEVEQQRQGMLQSFGAPPIQTRVDTQTGLAMLLRYDLYPSEAARQQLTRTLKQAMKASDGHLTTGFAGTPELPHALIDHGLEQEAFELLFQELAPSWLFEVNMGATTTWERWDSILPDGKISGTDMNSLNHYAYGAVEDFIVEKLIGINLPEVTDPEGVYRIEPHFAQQLDWIDGQLTTPNGPLSVKWQRMADQVKVTIDLPIRTKAILRLPNGQVMELNAGRTVVYSSSKVWE